MDRLCRLEGNKLMFSQVSDLDAEGRRSGSTATATISHNTAGSRVSLQNFGPAIGVIPVSRLQLSTHFLPQLD